MMKIVSLTVTHLHQLYEQGEHVILGPLLSDPAYVPALLAGGPCFAAIKDGQVVGAAGLTRQWEGRSIAWAILPRLSASCMLQIHRAALRFLGSCGERRIEAPVYADVPAASRWVRLLGFEHEYRACAYLPDGRDADLYARVRR